MRTWIKTAGLLLAILLVGSSLAQAANGRKSFRIVLVPERNIFEQQRKYRKLCDYTCSLLPMDMTFDVLKGYKEVLSALKDGRADGAFMGSFIGTYGIDNYGFIPLVRPIWPSGESHYHSYVFKRSDLSLTRDIATWKGRSFVFVGPHTSAGYYFPLSLLRSYGVEEPGEFFSKVQFAESHDAAVWMVANDMADLGAAKNTVFMEYTKRKPEVGEKVELLYSGGNYPDSTLVVGPGISREVREAVREIFLRMDSNQEGRETLKMFGAVKFINSNSEDFSEVRRVVEKSGFKIDRIRLLDQ